MSEELKPCPFCGSPGRVLVLSHGSHCLCAKCGCELGLSVYRKDAVEAWNSRHMPLCDEGGEHEG